MAAPDDGVYLPVPVARLIERMPAVVDAYGDERRRGYGMEDALIRAVYASFDDSPTTADEILGFMARGWDHTVPPEDAEAGRALFAETCSKCEMVYIAFPEGRPNGSPTPTPPPKAQAARLPTPRTAPPAGPPDPAGSNSRAWAAILLVLLGVMGLVILFGREAPPADVSAVSQPGVPVCADLVGKTITGDVTCIDDYGALALGLVKQCPDGRVLRWTGYRAQPDARLAILIGYQGRTAVEYDPQQHEDFHGSCPW